MTKKIDWNLATTILKLAYPIAIAMLSQTTVNLIDTAFIGRLPAEYSVAGQAAIGISMALLWGVGGLICSLSVGTQVIVARRIGEGKPLEAGQALNNALWVGLVTATIASAAFIYYLPEIFALIHQDPKVIEYGVQFATYRFIGVFSMVLTMVFKGFFDGIGRTKVHMTAAVVMNVANILLNWVLIFGIGPFPRMYVAGSGLASLIATFIGLAIMIYAAFEPGMRRTHGIFRRGSWDKALAKNVVRIGIPGGLGTLFLMTGFGAFQAIVGRLDAGQPKPIMSAATNVIIMNIMLIVFMLCIAFGQASATLVGQSLGARKPQLAESYGWTSVKLGALFMLFYGAIMIAFPEAFIWVFNRDPDVIDAGRNALRIMAAGCVPVAIGMILAQSLLGAGSTVYVMKAEFFLHFFWLVPSTWLFGLKLDLGISGVMCAALTYIVLLALAMAWKFRQGGWKEIRV